MKTFKFAVSSVAGLALALSFPAAALAQSYSQAKNDSSLSALIDELVEQNPGTSYDQIARAVKDEATTIGTSEVQVASEALVELNRQSNDIQIHSRSGYKPVADKVIGPSRNRGDVFYTPSATAGINHGHSGIYSYTTKIVEANPKSGITERPSSKVKVASGAHKQYVATSQENRNKAADRAHKYVGRGYNYNFAVNKAEGGLMNCSQTVWAAYKTATGIDLDSNGGHGVYPSDIANSKYTITYYRF